MYELFNRCRIRYFLVTLVQRLLTSFGGGLSEANISAKKCPTAAKMMMSFDNSMMLN